MEDLQYFTSKQEQGEKIAQMHFTNLEKEKKTRSAASTGTTARNQTGKRGFANEIHNQCTSKVWYFYKESDSTIMSLENEASFWPESEVERKMPPISPATTC